MTLKYQLFLLLPIFLIPPQAQALDVCRSLVRLSDFNLTLRPGVRESAEGDIPAHCRIDGVINEHIQFELRMPDEWNRRLLMLGTGGYSGYIADTRRRLDEGYAVVSTDTGHQGSSGDFLMHSKPATDYIHRAVHLTTLAAKDIVTTYYKRKPKKSYFEGCSNGGRQGLVEALWYPDDFDGIVAGAPAIELTRAQYWIIWAQQALANNPIDMAKLALIDNATRSACDTLDGVADGIISNPMSCTDEIFSPDSLICTEGQDTSSCLTKSEADTLSKLYQGPVLQNGRRLTYGLSKGAENAGDWQFWLFQGPDKGPPMNVVMGTAGLRAMMNDPEYNIMDFDLERDGHLIEERAKLGDVMDVDMTDFKRSGGKLLLYQGWNDAIVRPLVTINYFDQVAAESGDVNQFMRLFMMPGVTHCRRGPGPDSADFLATVVDWVEKGRAPNSIIASKQSKEGKVLRTRPICAYPMYAEYKGMGSIDRAENFQCSNP